jgi:hypothetical protein
LIFQRNFPPALFRREEIAFNFCQIAGLLSRLFEKKICIFSDLKAGL